jgi:hypothetical protein
MDFVPTQRDSFEPPNALPSFWHGQDQVRRRFAFALYRPAANENPPNEGFCDKLHEVVMLRRTILQNAKKTKSCHYSAVFQTRNKNPI